MTDAYVRGAGRLPFPYDADDHRLWRDLFAALSSAHSEAACEAFRVHAPALLRPEDARQVPQQAEVSQRLARFARFTIAPVASINTPRDFFGHLAARRFPATPYLRDPATPNFSPEPDWLHEYVGHILALAIPGVADLYELFGIAAANAVSDAERHRVEALYWFSMELGLIREGGAWRALGAAIVSSPRELQNLARVRVRPFRYEDVEAACIDDSEVQGLYFGVDSVEHLFELLRVRLAPLVRRGRNCATSGLRPGPGTGRSLSPGVVETIKPVGMCAGPPKD